MSTVENMVKSIVKRVGAFDKFKIFDDKKNFDGKLPKNLQVWCRQLVESDRLKVEIEAQTKIVEKLYGQVIAARDYYRSVIMHSGSRTLQNGFINFAAPLGNPEKAAQDNNRALWVKFKKSYPEFEKLPNKVKMDFGPTLDAYAKAWAKRAAMEWELKGALGKENDAYKGLMDSASRYLKGLETLKADQKVTIYFNGIFGDVQEEHDIVRKH